VPKNNHVSMYAEPGAATAEDLAATLVHSARAGDVRTTVVDGRILMRDRRLLTLDVPAITAELAVRFPALTERRKGRRVQDYDG
jgi:5-methylthioadenosine/S-adenosylhomocysteine deaminase